MVVFLLYSEDIKNANKLFQWNCERQQEFIEKGRGSKHWFPIFCLRSGPTLLTYYLDYFFSCILIRVRVQFYFVRVHYLLI